MPGFPPFYLNAPPRLCDPLPGSTFLDVTEVGLVAVLKGRSGMLPDDIVARSKGDAFITAAAEVHPALKTLSLNWSRVTRA